MRPTTKDLAKAAGVSRATVDRVLNERPGVQKKTIRAVNAAIEELGFVRNMSAANLAKGRVYRLLFLLPRIGGEFLQGIEREIGALRQAVRADSVEITIKRNLSRDPHKGNRTSVPTISSASTIMRQGRQPGACLAAFAAPRDGSW